MLGGGTAYDVDSERDRGGPPYCVRTSFLLRPRRQMVLQHGLHGRRGNIATLCTLPQRLEVGQWVCLAILSRIDRL